MIVYDPFWRTIEKKKISTYVLRERHGIDPKIIQRLQYNHNLTTKTLNKLCRALDCKLEDIAEYIPDKDE